MSEQPVAVPADVDPPTDRRAQRRRGALKIASRILNGRPLRWGFVLVAAGLGGYAVVSQWSQVHIALGKLGFLAIAGALVSVLLALAAGMQVWRVLLGALGSRLPIRAGARVFFVGQLGKYVPGSVWPVLAQMELGRVHQVPRRRSATAAVLTMLISLAAGLLAALVTLPFTGSATSGYRWAFLAIPILLGCLHPRVLNPAVDRLLRLARRPALEQPLPGRAVLLALAWALLSWVLYGLQIWLLAVRLGAPAGRGAVLAIGGFAFAWSVGFLVIFLPAGAGVRDGLVIASLHTVMGLGSATAVALVSRIVMTAGDLVWAGIAGWHRPAKSPAPAESDPTNEPSVTSQSSMASGPDVVGPDANLAGESNVAGESSMVRE